MAILLVYAAGLIIGILVLAIVAFFSTARRRPQGYPDQVLIDSPMTLKIFLDDKSFHCLKHSIPAGSRSRLLLHDPAHLSIVGSNTVITCDEAEARNLLLYASHCPGVIASIHKALRSAGLSLEIPEKLPSTWGAATRTR